MFERSKLYGQLPGSGNGNETPDLWLISYADLMTLLYIFFVVMYSFSSVDENRFRDLSHQIARSFGNTASTSGTLTGDQRELRAFHALMEMNPAHTPTTVVVEQIERELMARKSLNGAQAALAEIVQKTMPLLKTSRIESGSDTEDRVELLLPDVALFSSGSALLTVSAKEQLATIAKIIKSIETVSSVEIVGHTDSLPPKNNLFTNNWSLSSARAGAVAEELVRSGLNSRWVKASGRANLDPLFIEKNEMGAWNPENQAKNRRVQIIVKKRGANHE